MIIFNINIQMFNCMLWAQDHVERDPLDIAWAMIGMKYLWSIVWDYIWNHVLLSY